MSTYSTIAHAAKRLNLSKQQVRSLCRDGKLPATQYGKTWIMEEYDVSKYYDKNPCGVAEDQPCSTTNREGFKTLSFFSGAMGLDTGLEREGVNILLSCEIDNACRKTIKKNKPDIGLIGDIEQYSPEEIKEMAGLRPDDEIDLIIGGPPCQAFSTAGKRKGFNDQRGNLLLVYLNIIEKLQPKYAVIENVRGLLSAPIKHRPIAERGKTNPKLTDEELPGGAIKYIVNTLSNSGYGVSFNLYNAANFGTPQKRERVVMICSRDGKKAPYLVPTHSENGSFNLPKWKTIKEVIGNINEEEQHYINFPEKRLKYYRLLKAGQNWRNLPPELQVKAMGASFLSGGGKTGFYRRLSWEKPSPTLVTHPAMPATDLAHPDKNRPLSVEEYKLIQEFPKQWQIEGSLLEQYKQIGNAVPHSLGKAIGRMIKMLIANEEIPVYTDFPYSRYKNTSDKDFM